MASSAMGQDSTRKELEELDEMISDAITRDLVTQRAYDKITYRDQQAIGGSAIKEGRVVGTSTAVSDKGLTFNIGSPVLTCKKLRNAGVAGSLNFKGQSEDGLVKLLEKDRFNNTLSYGGTLLLFAPSGNPRYYESTRLALHDKLRVERNRNEGHLFPGFELGVPVPPDGWATEFDQAAGWETAKAALLVEFAAKWRAAYAAYNTYKADNAPPAAEAAYRQAEQASQVAEKGLAQVLPKKWHTWSDKKKEEELEKHLPTTGATATSPSVTSWLSELQTEHNKLEREKRLKHYDSLQLATPWSGRLLVWGSLSALGNRSKQPLYDAALPLKGYKGDYFDNFFEGQLAFNGLYLHQWGKQYFSIGSGTTNKRNFAKKDLRTYQYVTSPPGSPSVTVVQAEAYPTKADNPLVRNVQLQYSIYWQKHNIGLDGTFRAQWSKGEYESRQMYTLGVFYTAQAGGSTLLLMPQARWNTIDTPDEFSLGISLAASIPGFITKK